MTQRSQRKELIRRWDPGKPADLNDTPFGYTPEGYKDYRGFPFAQYGQIYGRRFVKHDLSYADFSGVRLQRAEIADCRFTSADFRDILEKQNGFFGCVFDSCSFKKADIGFGTSRYEDCIFRNNDFSKAGFKNAVFRRTLFEKNRIKNSHFDATGFWNCTFIGLIEDVTFHGHYLFESDQERYGTPRDTGLHHVDFSEAKLIMVCVSDHCAVEDVVMPKDGSSCVIDAEKFMNGREGLKEIFPDSAEAIDSFIRIFLVDSEDQPKTIFSLADFEDLVGEQFGKAIYEHVKKLYAVK